MTDYDDETPLVPDPNKRGGKWRPTLQEAIEADWGAKRNPNKPQQFYEVETIYVWGNNPVREYKVKLHEIDDPGNN